MGLTPNLLRPFADLSLSFSPFWIMALQKRREEEEDAGGGEEERAGGPQRIDDVYIICGGAPLPNQFLPPLPSPGHPLCRTFTRSPLINHAHS